MIVIVDLGSSGRRRRKFGEPGRVANGTALSVGRSITNELLVAAICCCNLRAPRLP